MSLAFRIGLPTAMTAVLFCTLTTAERERNAWVAECARADQKAATSSDVESIQFILPFHHSEMVLDAIGFQWPAFIVAGEFAPVPQLHSVREPVEPTTASYVALAVAVGIYWFAIAVWADRTLIRRKRPIHSRVVRIILTVTFVLTALWFLLFLGKDLSRGWQEGPHGAYGLTAWLGLVAVFLLTEINAFRRRPAGTRGP